MFQTSSSCLWVAAPNSSGYLYKWYEAVVLSSMRVVEWNISFVFVFVFYSGVSVAYSAKMKTFSKPSLTVVTGQVLIFCPLSLFVIFIGIYVWFTLAMVFCFLSLRLCSMSVEMLNRNSLVKIGSKIISILALRELGDMK